MILVGLCGLGLAAVVFDRLQPAGSSVLQPQVALASANADDGEAAAIPALQPPPPERQSTTIARELARITGQRDLAVARLRDVFQPGEPWLVAEKAEPQPATSEIDPTRIEQFLGKHKLQAIFAVDGKWQAMIDSQSFSVGDPCWDGFKVAEITSQTVTLTCGGVKVTMELAK